MTVSISDFQHNDALPCAEVHNAEWRVLFTNMLSVIVANVVMLSVIKLCVVMLSVVMLIVIALSVVMLSVVILSVIMLNVILISVVILSVVAPLMLMYVWAFSYCIIHAFPLGATGGV